MFLVYLFIATHFLPVSELFILSTDDSDRTIVHRIFVSNGGQWGDWAKPEFCSNGTYAKGFSKKIDADQGDADDTALNAIKLHCYPRPPSGNESAVGTITSGQGPFGSYNYFNYDRTCGKSQDDFLTEFKLKVQQNQGIGDDTAANDVAFKCRDFDNGAGYEVAAFGGLPWGSWSPYSGSCPDNSAVCGLSTKIEGDQNIGAIHGDDTALNDVVFYCCS